MSSTVAGSADPPTSAPEPTDSAADASPPVSTGMVPPSTSTTNTSIPKSPASIPSPPLLNPPPVIASSPPPPAIASSPPPQAIASSPPPPAVPSDPPPAEPSVESPPHATPSVPGPPGPSNHKPAPGGSVDKQHSPPHSSKPAVKSSSPNPSSSGISTSLVVGVAVGAVLFLVLLTLFCLCCKRKKRRRSEPQFYEDPNPKDDDYVGQTQAWQQNAHQLHDQAIKIPIHISPPPVHASRPTFHALPSINDSYGVSGSSCQEPETPLPPPSPNVVLGFSRSTFTFEELERATDRFSDANLLGQGGFGYVHRGMLPNGKEIAVKQLKTGSGQGEREFQAEVEIISRVHHKHLVSLVGYCITGDKRLLVYEFVPNNTMEFHLHAKGRSVMDWPTRLKIALGAAKGLAYLHEDCHPKIIHRDIKAANILLDYKFEAKVADFGLAKLFVDNNTHVSTRVMGTFGYLAPEYAASGKLSEKSDVFSYGVMLLELITGRRPVDTTNSYMDDSLVDWARPMLTHAMEECNYDALVDTRLQHNYNINEMKQMISCASSCVRHSSRHRPRMSHIVRALEGDVFLDDLNDGVKPGHSTVYGSSEYDTGMYNSDMKRFRKLALRRSEEYTTSEYSQVTSEYGLNPSVSSGEAQILEMKAGKEKVNDDNSQG